MWKSERNVNDCFLFYVIMYQYFVYFYMYILHTCFMKQEIRIWRYGKYGIKDLKEMCFWTHWAKTTAFLVS